MDRKPIDLTGRRAPPAGRLSNAPWPLANASMTDGRRKMQEGNVINKATFPSTIIVEQTTID